MVEVIKNKIAELDKLNLKYFTGDYLSDSAIMFDYIDEMEVVSGTDRNKILYVNPKKGGSNLFGYTWRPYLSPTRNRTKSEYDGLYNTKLKDMYPEFKDIALEFRNLYFPQFKYSQIQINKQYCIPMHKDSMNMGESVLCSFGDYEEGGETFIDLGKTKLCIDARTAPVKFNGSKFKHWVEPWQSGTRYSLVFFHNLKKRPEILI